MKDLKMDKYTLSVDNVYSTLSELRDKMIEDIKIDFKNSHIKEYKFIGYMVVVYENETHYIHTLRIDSDNVIQCIINRNGIDLQFMMCNLSLRNVHNIYKKFIGECQ